MSASLAWLLGGGLVILGFTILYVIEKLFVVATTGSQPKVIRRVTSARKGHN